MLTNIYFECCASQDFVQLIFDMHIQLTAGKVHNSCTMHIYVYSFYVNGRPMEYWIVQELLTLTFNHGMNRSKVNNNVLETVPTANNQCTFKSHYCNRIPVAFFDHILHNYLNSSFWFCWLFSGSTSRRRWFITNVWKMNEAEWPSHNNFIANVNNKIKFSFYFGYCLIRPIGIEWNVSALGYFILLFVSFTTPANQFQIEHNEKGNSIIDFLSNSV